MLKITLVSLISLLFFSGCVQTTSNNQSLNSNKVCCNKPQIECPKAITIVKQKTSCNSCNDFPVTVRDNSNCSSSYNRKCNANVCCNDKGLENGK